jgi:murein DD-endopeptidase MepM/ murein hydrolase activator NlpD
MGVGGIYRLAQLHTTFPARPRNEIDQYEVQNGDTIFGIAEKFNLKPETILWGNYYTLADDPHRLKPGQILNILPIDGVYHKWSAGEGLNGISSYYGVDPQVIIDWAGNNLDADTIGDFANPNIEPGTMLVVPGGHREFISWSAPRITRQDPAVAKIFGPGACGQVMDGPVGNGTFVFPTVDHFLSGYDYSPETNHFGIDFGGNTGNSILAADTGVVVYAGWNDWGYGNVVVIDHGNGWQTLYGHLSTFNVECGSYAYQGDVIAAMGSTGNSSGPHLHFEMRSDTYGKANPWNFLN